MYMRKEGDSNPRFPLGEYTLSRRASYFPNYFVFNYLQTPIFRTARILHTSLRFNTHRMDAITLEESTLTKEKPASGHAIISNQIGQPRQLEQVAIRLFFAGVHVPPIDAIAVGEGFLPTNQTILLQKAKSHEEPTSDLDRFNTLHNQKHFIFIHLRNRQE